MRKHVGGLLIVGNLLAAVASANAGANLLGPYVNFLEDDDEAFGVVYAHDVTASQRVFVSAEMAEISRKDHSVSGVIVETAATDVDYHEIEIGHLWRFTRPENELAFFVGPSAAVQLDDGTLDILVTGPEGAIRDHAELDYDPGFNVYATAWGEYVSPAGVGLFASYSYGFSFDRDLELRYDDGFTEEVEVESDTFWNASIGVFVTF